MNGMKHRYFYAALALFVASALMLEHLIQSQAARSMANMTCRPSAPSRILEEPKIIFWGNSLAFDHGWNVPDHIVVNCARQGMTAEAALPLTVALPRVEMSAVVLFFGTVELLRDIKDTGGFRNSIGEMVRIIQDIYPDARIVVAGVPVGGAAVWAYADHPKVMEINDILRGIAGTSFIDTTEVLAAVPESRRSYDRVHLTPESYRALEFALAGSLAKAGHQSVAR